MEKDIKVTIPKRKITKIIDGPVIDEDISGICKVMKTPDPFRYQNKGMFGSRG